MEPLHVAVRTAIARLRYAPTSFPAAVDAAFTFHRIERAANLVRLYNRDGEEIDLFAWSDHFHDPEYQLVGLHRCGPYLVTTLWLGLPYPGTGDKGIFETRVSKSTDAGYTRFFKWNTETEAQEGHDKLVTAAEMKSQVKREEVSSVVAG